MPALNALLAGLVDYAGLFPPAAEDMTSAVRAYAAYRSGPNARSLGSFVVPAARLDEFERALRAHGAAGDDARPWPVSVLAGEPAEADVERALRLAAPADRSPSAQAVSIEARAESAAAVERISAAAPAALTVAIEIPLALARDERGAVLSAVKAAGRTAKMRTGGVTPDAIPSARQVAGFIWDCARAGVAFKATAGLHHPVRAEQRLTYAADSPRAVMHGFVNVFLAASVAWGLVRNGDVRTAPEPPAAVAGILQERDASAFRLEGASIRWRELRIPAADIAGARGGLARSFGSCSFVEPLSGLEALGWLPRGLPSTPLRPGNPPGSIEHV
jgi:hypothetical protein